MIKLSSDPDTLNLKDVTSVGLLSLETSRLKIESALTSFVFLILVELIRFCGYYPW
jgi:hypothetical protein